MVIFEDNNIEKQEIKNKSNITHVLRGKTPRRGNIHGVGDGEKRSTMNRIITHSILAFSQIIVYVSYLFSYVSVNCSSCSL